MSEFERAKFPGLLVPFDHEAMANYIDTMAFYTDESVDTLLGRMVQQQVDKDERCIEILNSLALVMYPNDYGDYSLDETGEAFFYGTVLGIDTVEKYAAVQSIDDADVKRAWRKQYMHGKLQKLKWIPDERPEDIDRFVQGAIAGRSLPLEYCELLTKLSFELDHGEDEGAAFYQGFYYMLLSGIDAVRASKMSAIRRMEKEAMRDFDEELKRLLEG